MTQWGIDTLFNPGKRHMDEEKRRLQSTREEIGDSSGGKRIDLEGGKVRLADKSATDQTAPDDAEESGTDQAEEASTDAAEEASTDAAEESGTDQAEESEEVEDSPAARARRRRRNV
jgi:hypothetical protein